LGREFKEGPANASDKATHWIVAPEEVSVFLDINTETYGHVLRIETSDQRVLMSLPDNIEFALGGLVDTYTRYTQSDQ